MENSRGESHPPMGPNSSAPEIPAPFREKIDVSSHHPLRSTYTIGNPADSIAIDLLLRHMVCGVRFQSLSITARLIFQTLTLFGASKRNFAGLISSLGFDEILRITGCGKTAVREGLCALEDAKLVERVREKVNEEFRYLIFMPDEPGGFEALTLESAHESREPFRQVDSLFGTRLAAPDRFEFRQDGEDFSSRVPESGAPESGTRSQKSSESGAPESGTRSPKKPESGTRSQKSSESGAPESGTRSPKKPESGTRSQKSSESGAPESGTRDAHTLDIDLSSSSSSEEEEERNKEEEDTGRIGAALSEVGVARSMIEKLLPLPTTTLELVTAIAIETQDKDPARRPGLVVAMVRNPEMVGDRSVRLAIQKLKPKTIRTSAAPPAGKDLKVREGRIDAFLAETRDDELMALAQGAIAKLRAGDQQAYADRLGNSLDKLRTAPIWRAEWFQLIGGVP